MRLIHVTSEKNIASIRENGLSELSYWTCRPEIAEYYESTINDEGHSAVFFTIDLVDLDADLFDPDYASLSEPIMSCVREMHRWGKYDSEERVHEEWQSSDRLWQDSLHLVGCIRYRGAIAFDKINFFSYLSDDPVLNPLKI